MLVRRSPHGRPLIRHRACGGRPMPPISCRIPFPQHSCANGDKTHNSPPDCCAPRGKAIPPVGDGFPVPRSPARREARSWPPRSTRPIFAVGALIKRPVCGANNRPQGDPAAFRDRNRSGFACGKLSACGGPGRPGAVPYGRGAGRGGHRPLRGGGPLWASAPTGGLRRGRGVL